VRVRISLPIVVCAAAVLFRAATAAEPAGKTGTLNFSEDVPAEKASVPVFPTRQDADKAATVFADACLKCHPVERVVAVRRSRLQWEEVMTQMTSSRGAQIPDEQWDVVLDYLVRQYGIVHVNRAPAEDIAEVLEISESTAASIVAYRREHGPFKDLDALLKVPGVDGEKLKQKRDAIAF
jgi:competence ComEA-like helix-hairpin-helix protein